MPRFLRFARALALVTSVGGCYESTVVVVGGLDAQSPDGGARDAQALVDARARDAGPVDCTTCQCDGFCFGGCIDSGAVDTRPLCFDDPRTRLCCPIPGPLLPPDVPV